MDRILTSFISALRNADVRISTSETLDALHAVDLVGYDNRTLLRNSLSLVLPKTRDEKSIFDATFDHFFSLRGPQRCNRRATKKRTADIAKRSWTSQSGQGDADAVTRTGSPRPRVEQLPRWPLKSWRHLRRRARRSANC